MGRKALRLITGGAFLIMRIDRQGTSCSASGLPQKQLEEIPLCRQLVSSLAAAPGAPADVASASLRQVARPRGTASLPAAASLFLPQRRAA